MNWVHFVMSVLSVIYIVDAVNVYMKRHVFSFFFVPSMKCIEYLNYITKLQTNEDMLVL